jgi:hypothetical protein
MKAAALGFRVHTGWAAMVALAGPAASPRVIERSRIALADTDETEALQAYHLAEEAGLAEAARIVDQARRAARTVATRSIAAAVARLRADHKVERGAIVGGNSKVPGSLEAILRSHAMIHAAEGELFRTALADACAAEGVSIVEVPSNDLEAQAAAVLGLDGDRLRARIVELGAGLSSPWAQDQKESALVAWLALHRKR